MGFFKCEHCGIFYFSDTFEGFDCIHCKGKIVKATNEEYEEAVSRFNSAEFPTVSC